MKRKPALYALNIMQLIKEIKGMDIMPEIGGIENRREWVAGYLHCRAQVLESINRMWKSAKITARGYEETEETYDLSGWTVEYDSVEDRIKITTPDSDMSTVCPDYARTLAYLLDVWGDAVALHPPRD